MGLLARLHPELVPTRPSVEREQRPGPRERERDTRPEWIRRRDEGRLPAKELVR